MEPLLPVRHPNRDFFVCDIFDGLPYFKDDMASMEHPLFSLSTKPDTRLLHYEHNGNTLTIKPSYTGLATIHDKDILLYCASYLRAAMADGHIPSQIVRFTSYDFFVSTNRKTNGAYYSRFKAGLDRLAGTRINTNIKTDGLTIEKGFGLIEWWQAVKEDESGRVIAAEVKLSDWMYHAIVANELLTISRDYFRLRKPLERRIYELARKHCGEQPEWQIRLKTLHKKIGTTAAIRKLRFQINRLIETNHLPDYSVSMQEDLVTFTNRHPPKEERTHVRPLRPDTCEKAHEVAPGWDIYYLEQEWREWIADKEPPQNPDAAFIGFCKQRFRKRGRP